MNLLNAQAALSLMQPHVLAPLKEADPEQAVSSSKNTANTSDSRLLNGYSDDLSQISQFERDRALAVQANEFYVATGFLTTETTFFEALLHEDASEVSTELVRDRFENIKAYSSKILKSAISLFHSALSREGSAATSEQTNSFISMLEAQQQMFAEFSFSETNEGTEGNARFEGLRDFVSLMRFQAIGLNYAAQSFRNAVYTEVSPKALPQVAGYIMDNDPNSASLVKNPGWFSSETIGALGFSTGPKPIVALQKVETEQDWMAKAADKFKAAGFGNVNFRSLNSDVGGYARYLFSNLYASQDDVPLLAKATDVWSKISAMDIQLKLLKTYLDHSEVLDQDSSITTRLESAQIHSESAFTSLLALFEEGTQNEEKVVALSVLQTHFGMTLEFNNSVLTSGYEGEASEFRNQVDMQVQRSTSLLEAFEVFSSERFGEQSPFLQSALVDLGLDASATRERAQVVQEQLSLKLFHLSNFNNWLDEDQGLVQSVLLN